MVLAGTSKVAMELLSALNKTTLRMRAAVVINEMEGQALDNQNRQRGHLPPCAGNVLPQAESRPNVAFLMCQILCVISYIFRALLIVPGAQEHGQLVLMGTGHRIGHQADPHRQGREVGTVAAAGLVLQGADPLANR